jgi:CRP-like cAMP-binding protein
MLLSGAKRESAKTDTASLDASPRRFNVKLDPAAFHADPELLDGLEPKSATIQCSDYRVLFRQGDNPDGLYILFSGSATLTMNSPQGKQIVSMQPDPGSVLGLPGLIGNEPYTLTAVAHPGAILGYISRDEFLAIMSTDQRLAFKVLQVLAAEVRSARKALRDR